MTPAEMEAAELLGAVGRSSPDAVSLAQVVSLAARIEPELLRQARIKLLPQVDAGAEADLWFSPLVQSASPVALVLLPEVAALLRLRLSQSGLLQRSWELLRRVHEHAPAAIKLEEEVTWRALSGDAGAGVWIERELMSVVSAIVNQGRGGLARWALRALPRLPDVARRTQGATMLALASAARLGSWQILSEQVKGRRLPPGTLSRLRVVLPPDLPQASVGVRLFEEGPGGAKTRKGSGVVTGVEFSRLPTPPDTAGGFGAVIEVPATIPLLLEVSWHERSRRVVKHLSLSEGQTETVEVGGLPVTVRTVRGDVYTLRRGEQSAGQRVAGAGHVAPPTQIPRPPAFGFVPRRDAQGRDIIGLLMAGLAPGHNRLVTLSGPGGIGKTTLAAEAARALLDAYGGRVVWSSAEDRADFTLLSLLDDVATQLGHPELRTLSPAQKKKEVRAAAAGALVVLDGHQAVAGAGQKQIVSWLRQTECSALFTSRTLVPATVVVTVSAMSLEEAATYMERLVAQTPYPQIFTPDVRERVYKTAEGNPFVMLWVIGQINLAQEPDAVLEELKRGKGDVAGRLFDRSFNLPQLGEDGRAALLALSLFAPSASPEALAQAAGFGDDWTKRLEEAINNLQALWLVKGADGSNRLAVEGLTRSMAAARLSKDPRAADFRRRFVAYFLAFTHAHQEPTAENFDALEGEFENVAVAVDMAFQLKDWQSVVSLCASISGFLDTRGYWDEALRRSEQARSAALRAKLPEPQPTRFAEIAANIHLRRGEYVRAKSGFNSVLASYRATRYQPGVAQSLRHLGNIAVEQNNLSVARKLYTQSLEISRSLDDPQNLANNLHNLAVVLQAGGEFEEARRSYREALSISEKLGDRQSVATTLHQLGVTAAEMGDLPEARRLYEESLKINLTLGAQEAVGSTYHQMGRLSVLMGNSAEAGAYLRQALAIFESIGSPAAEQARKDLESLIELALRPLPSKKISKSAAAKKTAGKASKSSKSSAAKAANKSTAKTRVASGRPASSSGKMRGGRGGSAKGGAGRPARPGGRRGGFGGRSGLRTK